LSSQSDVSDMMALRHVYITALIVNNMAFVILILITYCNVVESC